MADSNHTEKLDTTMDELNAADDELEAAAGDEQRDEIEAATDETAAGDEEIAATDEPAAGDEEIAAGDDEDDPPPPPIAPATTSPMASKVKPLPKGFVPLPVVALNDPRIPGDVETLAEATICAAVFQILAANAQAHVDRILATDEELPPFYMDDADRDLLAALFANDSALAARIRLPPAACPATPSRRAGCYTTPIRIGAATRARATWPGRVAFSREEHPCYPISPAWGSPRAISAPRT